VPSLLSDQTQLLLELEPLFSLQHGHHLLALSLHSQVHQSGLKHHQQPLLYLLLLKLPLLSLQPEKGFLLPLCHFVLHKEYHLLLLYHPLKSDFKTTFISPPIEEGDLAERS